MPKTIILGYGSYTPPVTHKRKLTRNEIKANRIAAVLYSHGGDEFCHRTNIIDGLTDIMHLCDALSSRFKHEHNSFEYLLQAASEHYLCETTQPDDIELARRECEGL